MNNYILIAAVLVCGYALARKLVKLAITIGVVTAILYLIDNLPTMMSVLCLITK